MLTLSADSPLQEIAKESGRCVLLKKNEMIKIIDPMGQQVCDLFCFNQDDHTEAFSAGHSLDFNDTLFLSTGHFLYSNRARPMLEIIADSCGRHDLLYPPCGPATFILESGGDEHHPSCQENLELNFFPHGIRPAQVSTTFNIFMNVELSVSGKVSICPPKSKAQDYLLLKAHMDLLLGLTACSHETSNGGQNGPIHYQVFCASP